MSSMILVKIKIKEERLRGGSLQKLEKMIEEQRPQLEADLQSLELAEYVKQGKLVRQ